MFLKNFLTVILLFLIIGCSSYKIKNIYFKSETIKLNAKIDSIDSTEHYYVYYISNDTLKAYFSKPKLCSNSFKTSLELNRTYSLKVKTDANTTYRFKINMGDDLYVEDRFFESDEPRLILDDCFNICGNTINIDQ